MASFFIAVIFPAPELKSATEKLTVDEKSLLNDAFEHEESPAKGNASATQKQVQLLDWFDVVDAFFTRYTLTAKVIDVQTGKSYYVQRVGGYYHADVQPINSANTAIMKEIYGGVWSWTRRPVWVVINGTPVAASINGMPHGYSLIEGNNMNGHTCIHFLNSKTHGTKRVDEAHQAAVDYAYQHRNEFVG